MLKSLSGYLNLDNIMLAIAMLGTCIFTVLAARAQCRLWQKTLHIACRRQTQHFITAGKAHLR